MQVHPLKLRKLIRKASFHDTFPAVQISFDSKKIVSRMASPKGDVAVFLDMPNDVLTGLNGQNETVNFNLSLERNEKGYIRVSQQ